MTKVIEQIIVAVMSLSGHCLAEVPKGIQLSPVRLSATSKHDFFGKDEISLRIGTKGVPFNFMDTMGGYVKMKECEASSPWKYCNDEMGNADSFKIGFDYKGPLNLAIVEHDTIENDISDIVDIPSNIVESWMTRFKNDTLGTGEIIVKMLLPFPRDHGDKVAELALLQAAVTISVWIADWVNEAVQGGAWFQALEDTFGAGWLLDLALSNICVDAIDVVSFAIGAGVAGKVGKAAGKAAYKFAIKQGYTIAKARVLAAKVAIFTTKATELTTDAAESAIDAAESLEDPDAETMSPINYVLDASELCLYEAAELVSKWDEEYGLVMFLYEAEFSVKALYDDEDLDVSFTVRSIPAVGLLSLIVLHLAQREF